MENSKTLKLLFNFIGFEVRKSYAKAAITCPDYAKTYNETSQDALVFLGDHILNVLLSAPKIAEKININKEKLIEDYLKTEKHNEFINKNIKEKMNNFLLYTNIDLETKNIYLNSLKAIIGAIYLSEDVVLVKKFLVKLNIIKEEKKNILDIIPSKYFEQGIKDMKEYEYKSLVYCVIDSVYSISATYTSTKNVVNRFLDYKNLNVNKQYYVSEFIEDFKEISHIELANNIFKNKQRTSAKNGILKALAVKEFVEVLYSNKIETKEDFINFKNREKLLREIKNIKGQTKGTNFDYLLMLAGEEQVFKRDRHIINFFTNYLNIIDTSKKNLEKEFNKQLKFVLSKYPNYNIKALDGVIWSFMANKK